MEISEIYERAAKILSKHEFSCNAIMAVQRTIPSRLLGNANESRKAFILWKKLHQEGGWFWNLPGFHFKRHPKFPNYQYRKERLFRKTMLLEAALNLRVQGFCK